MIYYKSILSTTIVDVKDKQNYDIQAFKLVKMFSENFELFKEHVDMEIIDAAPNLQAAE